MTSTYTKNRNPRYKILYLLGIDRWYKISISKGVWKNKQICEILMPADYNTYIKVGVLTGKPEPQGASTTKRSRRGWLAWCACAMKWSPHALPPPPSPKTSDRTTATPGKGTILNRARWYVTRARFTTTRGKTGFPGIASSGDHSGGSASILLLWSSG